MDSSNVLEGGMFARNGKLYRRLTKLELKREAEGYALDYKNVRGPKSWKEETREHWRKFRPKMYRELERAGHLEESLDNAVNSTWDALENQLDKGVPWDSAWEQVREMWMLLPSEEDVPRLGENPNKPVVIEIEDDLTEEAPRPRRSKVRRPRMR